MNNSLALIQPDEYRMLEAMGQTLLRSGFLPNSIKGPEQAIAIILAGRELGIAPWQALSTINVIQGKPTVSPQLMLALIQSSGQLESVQYDSDNTHCTVTMKRRGQPPHAETFSQEDAQAQGLWGKDNWKKQPKVMLRWRAVAACARIVFPDIILGLYTPEEMGADVNVTDDGGMTVISTSAEPVTATPTLPAATGNGNGNSSGHRVRDWEAIFRAVEQYYPEDTEDKRKAHWWNGTVKKLQKAGAITDAMTDAVVIETLTVYKGGENWWKYGPVVRVVNADLARTGMNLVGAEAALGHGASEYATPALFVEAVMSIAALDEALA